MVVQHLACAVGLVLVARPFGRGPPMLGGLGIGLPFSIIARAGLARAVQVDDLACHLGPIICSGRTTASKVASSTNPRLMASSFKVVPFLWAVLATVVALS